MASETSICNLSLSMIGDNTITTFGDEDTVEGRLCNRFYKQVRDEVLSMGPVNWHCVTKRAGQLAAVSNQPSFGWDYAYEVPPDSLRIIGLVTDDDDKDELTKESWKREGNYILTDEDEAYILYIKRPSAEDTADFPPNLVHAIAIKLASRLAVPLIGVSNGIKLRNAFLDEYEVFGLKEAMMEDASEGYVADEFGEHNWSEAGR